MKELPDLAGIPVIVLSAREPTGNKERAMQSHAAAYFQKPPDNRQFLSAIRHSLGESTGLATFLAT
jgi:CheY-like chemotaxis protein